MEEEGGDLYDVLINEDNIISEAEKEWTLHSLRIELERALALLPERDALVIRLYYGLGSYLPHTLDEIAKQMGLTSERVRQLKVLAIKQLKTTCNDRILKSYL